MAAWLSAALIWLFFLAAQQLMPTRSWLLDWHVYAAGGVDFLQRDLYYVPLRSSYDLPIEAFNYPPLAAVSVIPLLVLPDAIAGTLWVILNIAATVGAAVLATRIFGVRPTALWAGLAFLALTIHPWMRLAFLGNNTPLVLFLVIAFAHQHFATRQRRAGVLLGIAISLKLWPAALIPVLARERRWTTIAVAVGIVALVHLATLAWLGPDVVSHATAAMQVRAPIEPDNPVFFVSWLSQTQEWWPSWGASAVAIMLVAIPARGKVGIGLGIFAGLALVPNLWRTYAPTLVIATLFVLQGINDARLALRANRARTAPSIAGTPAAPAGSTRDA